MHWADGRAQLRHTHKGALASGDVQPDEDDLIFGVVRETMYGIDRQIDRNEESLAPPSDLLQEFKQIADDVGHNAAVDAVDFRTRYLDHLSNEAPQEAMSDVIETVEDGTSVWLVCYEDTDKKFCHRLILYNQLTGEL